MSKVSKMMVDALQGVGCTCSSASSRPPPPSHVCWAPQLSVHSMIQPALSPSYLDDAERKLRSGSGIIFTALFYI